MDLTKAQLGDQFRVYINSAGEISSSPHMRTMLATVIAVKKPQFGSGFILGWKKDEEHPINASPRANRSEKNEYVPNQALYVYGKSVSRTLPVAVQIFNGLDGFPCKKCHNFFPQAVANQNDGTMVCWSCRNRW
jgi:formylmethanofuran dehydrogenase subunit E